VPRKAVETSLDGTGELARRAAVVIGEDGDAEVRGTPQVAQASRLLTGSCP